MSKKKKHKKNTRFDIKIEKIFLKLKLSHVLNIEIKHFEWPP